MTTSETNEEIVRRLVADVKAKEEDGDRVAELALSLLEYVNLLHRQLTALQKLVLTHTDLIQMMVKIDTVTMPECPDNLPGYM